MVKKAAVSLMFLFVVSGGVFIAMAFYVMDVVSPLRQVASLPAAADITSTAWAVFDPTTGKVLLSKNEAEPLPIASVTKLFLADELLANEDMFATTTITWGDLANYGTAGQLKHGVSYDFYTLLFPLLLSSSNDAASVMERNFPDAVENLNATSDELALSATFADGSGLSSHNKASAEAVATLASRVYQTDKQVLAITALPYHAVDLGGWQNNNPVSGMTGYRGGKHGYTDAAKHTLVAFFDEDTVLGGSRTLGYVLLGSDDLVGDTKTLRRYTENRLWWYALQGK